MPDLPTHHTEAGYEDIPLERCPLCQGERYHDVPESIGAAIRVLTEYRQGTMGYILYQTDFLTFLQRDNWRRDPDITDGNRVLAALAACLGMEGDAEDLAVAARHMIYCGGYDDRPVTWCPNCRKTYYPLDEVPQDVRRRHVAVPAHDQGHVCPKGHRVVPAPFRNHPVTEDVTDA